MKIKDNPELACYCHGIVKFEKYDNHYQGKEQNPNLIKLVYGGGSGIVFHKDKSYDLMKAIYGEEYLVSKLGITKKKFDEYVEDRGLLNILNGNLIGRGFVVVTGFREYYEYTNAAHNSYIGITGMGLDGELYAKDTDELFTDKATYDEMYNYKSTQKDDRVL